MKKVKILLASAAVVAVVAGAFAVKARDAKVVYLPKNDLTTICDVPQSFSTFVPNSAGPHRATFIQGAPCQRGTVITLAND